MDIQAISNFKGKPEPFETGTAVMWTDPYISDQLVELHLTPEIEAASRKEQHINATIEWISDQLETDNAKYWI